MVPSGDKRLLRSNILTSLSARHHMGLAIYDPRENEWLLRYRADNGFTPASNIKILTLYAALQVLDEQIEAGRYVLSGDSLLIWGGGDPGTLYPDIHASDPLVTFLSGRSEHVVFSSHHFATTRYGSGWAWDDYGDAYQCERTAFPIYGNRLWITRVGERISTTPQYLFPSVRIIQDTIEKAERTEWGDGYTYHVNPAVSGDPIQIPITFFANDTRRCWEEATHRTIQLSDQPLRSGWTSIQGSDRDTLLKTMMQESDNFIAEQLLLAASFRWFDQMSETQVIDSLLKGPLAFLKADSVRWVDGSGLSRYNVLTPQAVVKVLHQLYQEKGMNFISGIFPAGGVSGTLRQWYKGRNGRPFLFAKTGTLRGVHSLSGYLVTRSGRILIFSWMHNQVQDDLSDIKSAMHSFFSFLYESY